MLLFFLFRLICFLQNLFLQRHCYRCISVDPLHLQPKNLTQNRTLLKSEPTPYAYNQQMCVHINKSRDKSQTGIFNQKKWCQVHYLIECSVDFMNVLCPRLRPRDLLVVSRRNASIIYNTNQQDTVDRVPSVDFV